MGTATYVTLNSVVILSAVFVLRPWRHQSWRPTLVTLACLLCMTAVFDSIIIGLGIVAYDQTKLTGIRIGFAPIEDFGYSLLASLMLPTIWKFAGRWRKEETREG